MPAPSKDQRWLLNRPHRIIFMFGRGAWRMHVRRNAKRGACAVCGCSFPGLAPMVPTPEVCSSCEWDRVYIRRSMGFYSGYRCSGCGLPEHLHPNDYKPCIDRLMAAQA